MSEIDPRYVEATKGNIAPECHCARLPAIIRRFEALSRSHHELAREARMVLDQEQERIQIACADTWDQAASRLRSALSTSTERHGE